jgi:hypothetical protein
VSNNRIVWEVKLDIIGPVKVDSHIQLIKEKGFDLDQFYSYILIKNSRNGFTANVTAYAPNADLAYKAAFIYFGRMVDLLSFNINLPLEQYVNTRKEKYNELFNRKRILKRLDFEKAFNEVRQIEEQHGNDLLKALSWFRKARISQDAIDQFIAYWNVLEILGNAYHTETSRTNRGVINKVYQCFIDYFGEVGSWPVDESWINQMNNIRNRIVHGGHYADLETIEQISKQLKELDHTSFLIIKSIKNKHFVLQETIDYDEF